MSFLEFIILLIIAGVCGSIGQAISGYSRGGCLLSIVIGFIGALIGMGLADFFNLPEIFIDHRSHTVRGSGRIPDAQAVVNGFPSFPEIIDNEGI